MSLLITDLDTARGLATAAGLCAAGWEVTVCERAASVEPVGAGLALAPNGLRALDVFGAGLRALATVYDWQPPVAADAGGAS
jgi:2-polyprenyl-6-methoxyphenol hydroxylase-like FAD-dependent oxidoreductase